jgi:signal transduction histidine kinase
VPEPARDDEVRDLAAAVNQMAERLSRYEQETRASERLQTLGTLGGGIAHQIRNAATGCRMAIDLHQRDCESSQSAAADEPLVVAVRQLELIETHVRQFLTLGRPPSAQRTAANLAETIDEAISLVQPAAVHCGAEIQFEPPLERIELLADPPALVQMLVNLLVNAVQAAAQAKVAAGPVDREPAGVIVELSRPAADRARIAIGDPGPGPAPAIQDRLFEPFATDKPGGTGLGLVVARQIAEDHGGSIRWQRRNERTWFLVELPSSDL